MAQKHQLGQAGEEQAARYLMEKGYRIVQRNWRFLKAEIDLIARKGDTLVFVEVKTRSSLDFGLPQDFVNRKKIQTLITAIHAYLQWQPAALKARLDIIAIHRTPKGFDIAHLEDAYHYF